MNFIRPEARAAMSKWRDLLIGLALIAAGLLWLGSAHGFLVYVAGAVTLLGAVLAFDGLRRGRFLMARVGQGPGVVVVDEGEVTYLGPLSGGSVALAELDRLVLDPTGRPAHWVLESAGQPALHIPVNAEGADALFDAFALLPGLRTGHMLDQLNAHAPHASVIWERNPTRPPAGLLN